MSINGIDSLFDKGMFTMGMYQYICDNSEDLIMLHNIVSDKLCYISPICSDLLGWNEKRKCKNFF